MIMAEEAVIVSTQDSSSDEESTSSPSPDEEEEEIPSEEQCQMCRKRYKQPRILSCLHVFCTPCLEERAVSLENGTMESDAVGAGDAAMTFRSMIDRITCDICSHETMLHCAGPAGVLELPLDELLIKEMGLTSGDSADGLVCTSCKAREKAVARCSDCANLLCSNCVTAHNYMRCFENHSVIMLEDLPNGEALQKPVFCLQHPTENYKLFCVSCQMLVCVECVSEIHKEPVHKLESIPNVECCMLESVKGTLAEGRNKLSLCSTISDSFGNDLTELQLQRDSTRGFIEETFQSYKAILEECKDRALTDLDSMHHDRELAIMDKINSAEKVNEKLEDACLFVERFVNKGSGMDILALKRLIDTHLFYLFGSVPKLDSASLNEFEFVTDRDQFKEAVKLAFGKFKGLDKESSSKETGSRESLDMTFFTGVLSPDTSNLPTVTGEEILQGLQSLQPLLNNSVATVPPPMPTVDPPRSSSRNSHSPAMSDSGVSVDNSSNSSTSGQLTNLSNVARCGTVSVNSQGQITLNGKVLPGLNVNNVSGLPQNTACPIPGSLIPDSDLNNILGSINLSSTSVTNTSSSRSNSQISTTAPLASSLGIDIQKLLSQSSSAVELPPVGGVPLLGSGGQDRSSALSINTSSSGETSTPSPTSFTTISPQPPYMSRSGKMSAMQIRFKFGQLGPAKGQFNSPHGFCLGIEEDIVVADTNNHRVQVFEKTGEFKYQFGIPGREEGQLWYPRKVAVMRGSGKFVVCDRGNERSRMQIFNKNGHFVKKIAIRYIDIVAGLAITTAGHIVAVDSVSPTVFCIAETGDLLKWFDCSDYMREPSDIAVSGREYFVCDFKGHCVVVFNEDGQFLRRIGCENITNFPNGIDISDAGDVLIGDSHGNRFHVGVFQRDGSLIGEFECPYVKVSRCCGLKITSEGYVVTLAKNNHHVLVLNTLYIA